MGAILNKSKKSIHRNSSTSTVPLIDPSKLSSKELLKKNSLLASTQPSLLKNKTPTQLAFEQARLKRLANQSPQPSTHKERVQKFNEYLAKLSDHHDIPKVGPG